MTLPTTTSAVTYAGNGVTAQFDWTFLIPSGALEVYLTENDIASVRPLRASVAGTATEADAAYLTALETEADTLRTERAELVATLPAEGTES